MKRKLLISLLAIICVLCLAVGLAACGDKGGNDDSGAGSHNYAAAWVYDATYHWHECTALHDCDGSQKIEHSDANHDNVCDGCNHLIPSKGLEFEYDGVISGYMFKGIGTCTDTDIVIPMYANAEEYIGYAPVTGVDMYIFEDDETITSIVMPDSVVYIGDYAFMYCTALESVTLSNSLTEISHDSFSGCTALESIVIPNSVTTIKYDTFMNCESLANVTIGSAVESIESNAFCDSLITNLTFVNSTVPLEIGDYVFGGMSVTSISVPDRITYLGKSVFADLALDYTEYENALYLGTASNPYAILVQAIDNTATTYNVHADTKVISGEAFRGSNVTITVNLPAGIKGVGAAAFSGRANVDVHYNNTQAEWLKVNKTDFGSNASYWTVTCTDGGYHKN
ncbi:MAG: leucine-rich repeat domain-containing protein [Bacteroides sp.]|nr:leucine-rich repeat domain-containing protein [Bacillota bacterium]MCM1393833.1 leucine-rich repeat domain-containing protein [[Eubacterium] siraeum]MCM1455464.1 leucine-rich repeat domain-containing protein [Bacteroides sp.]